MSATPSHDPAQSLDLVAIKAEIRRMWDVERRTSPEIAKLLGITRNMVMGHVSRMKLTKRPSPIRRIHDLVLKKQVARPKPPPMLPVMTTAMYGCRFIAGEPKGMATVYCNEPRIAGKSWCPSHQKQVYQGKIRAVDL